MKNTKNAIIILASIMVIVGTTLTPTLLQQVNAAVQVRSQHIDQENLCYRTNTCRQSEVGQNTLGNDNQVTGFADQSDNIQQAAAPTPANQTTTPTGNQTTTPLTCEQCFRSLLNGTQISELVATFPARSLGEVCTGLENSVISESNLRLILLGIGVSGTITDELIACLKAAGIVFT